MTVFDVITGVNELSDRGSSLGVSSVGKIVGEYVVVVVVDSEYVDIVTGVSLDDHMLVFRGSLLGVVSSTGKNKDCIQCDPDGAE